MLVEGRKSMGNNLVSIIIPVYNVAQYLGDCLKSVLKQTYTNLEIIVVDDGSTDNSLEICHSYAAEDKRIKVIHQENAGVSAARNVGLRIMTGKYVLFVDSDDRIKQNMVEILVKVLDENSKIDAVFCGYKEFDDETGEIIKEVAPSNLKQVNRDEGVAEIFGEYSTMLWNKMFRCLIIDKLDLFDVTLKIGEDELWMVDVLKRANNIMLIGTPLYYYRSRAEGASKGQAFSEAKMTDYESQKKVLKSINEYSSEALTLYAQQRLYYTGQDIMKLAYYGGYFEIYEMIDHEIDEARRVWFDHHSNKLGKIRRRLVEAMMRKRVPSRIVKIFDK